MISNPWFYLLLIINISLLCYASVLFYSHHQNRNGAIHIICFRPLCKILICVCSGIGLIINLPHSLIFLGVFLSVPLAVFAMDIVIQKNGVFFGHKLMLWQEIKEIYDDYFALHIKTSGFLSRKGFLKILWRIRKDDVQTLKSLHREALTTRCT